ncbi:MAG: glycosyltransferase family 4 protein [Chloroflexi bacterium]|nr:glycosyltransferase family 4 protein [Chloroflexota bacterium]
MRIGLVSAYDYPYPGGVSEHIRHLDEEYRRTGHYVKVIAPSSTDEEQLESGNVYKLGSVVRVPNNGSMARITLSLRLSGKTKRILRQEQFDVVHLHEPLLPALPLTVLRHSKALNIGTFHAFQTRSLAYFYAKPILRRFFNKLHGQVAVSEAASDFVGKYFKGSYTIIPNGIDLALFNPRAEPIRELSDGHLNVLFVGRLDKRKGFRYLLEAFPYVLERVPTARLVVAGAFSEGQRQRYESVATSLGVRDITFTGFVPSDQLARLYRSADVFCAPSTGGESFGIILLEAMAMGKPIVASNIVGYRELIRHGQEGLLVEPKNPRSVADALIQLLGNAELRQSMGESGRFKALDYSWSQIAARLIAYYRDVGARHGFTFSDDRERQAARSFGGYSANLLPMQGDA